MSRHRSPSGRHPHRWPSSGGATLPGAAPRPASGVLAAPPTQSALRNGLKAAAVTGGALALVMPALTVELGPAGAPADAALRLAANGRAVEPVHGVRVGAVTDDPDSGLVASVLPVDQDDQPEPPQAEAADLLKAAGLYDLARQRAEKAAAVASCSPPLAGLGRVRPWVRAAAEFLSCLFGEPRLIGVASRAGTLSDHPLGLAVDFMVSGARGDQLAACALRNRKALGVEYVIYKQRINYGEGWQPMEDRGSITANHFDHVHVSFRPTGAGGKPLSDLCG